MSKTITEGSSDGGVLLKLKELGSWIKKQFIDASFVFASFLVLIVFAVSLISLNLNKNLSFGLLFFLIGIIIMYIWYIHIEFSNKTGIIGIIFCVIGCNFFVYLHDTVTNYSFDPTLQLGILGIISTLIFFIFYYLRKNKIRDENDYNIKSTCITLRDDDDSKIKHLENLAKKIWIEYYKGIFGKNDAEIMVNSAQNIEKIKDDIDHGYKYYIIHDENTDYRTSFGYYSYKEIKKKDVDGGELELYKLYIKDTYRGKKIGKKIISKLNEMGYKKISLHVFAENIKAIEFYSKIGFKITGYKEDYILIPGKKEIIKPACKMELITK